MILIKGTTPKTTTGHLNLTTVDVSTGDVNMLEALWGWLQHDRVVVPHDSIYPPGQSQQQVDQQDHADFVGSQDNAQAAAFCELGYPQGVSIVSVSTDSKAKGVLQAGDQIVTVNGTDVGSIDKLSKVLEAATPETNATVDIKRDGSPMTVSVPLVAAPKGSKGARMGVTVAGGCVAPFQVDLGLADQIGGPSAGMMFALGIMDKVGDTDLTYGRFIAGTGTIDASGNVGAIGGIQLKMIAARRAGATVFLAPSGNCGDVRGNVPKGLDVVEVTTLHEAVRDLQAIHAGSAVPHC
ncbi:MAG: PDZ domain-containing protein [Actinobacteria bacterium]|nr:PDZ domain-containing protein [Actinomycetota bacterium]